MIFKRLFNALLATTLILSSIIVIKTEKVYADYRFNLTSAVISNGSGRGATFSVKIPRDAYVDVNKPVHFRADCSTVTAYTTYTNLTYSEWTSSNEPLDVYSATVFNSGSYDVTVAYGQRLVEGFINVKPEDIIPLDTTPPKLTLTQNTTTLSNGAIIIATGSDDVGVVKIKTPDGNYINASTTNYTVSANGIYSFTVYDSAGNSVTKTISISNIGKITPTAPTFNQDIKTWTNGNVKVVPEYPVIDNSINIIKNGDFTNGLTGWSAQMPDNSVVLNYIDTPYGKGVRVIKSVGTYGDWPLCTTSTASYIYKAGKTYTFSWYYKTTKGSGRPYSVGWWIYDNGAYRCSLPVKEIPLENDWTYAEASYTFSTDHLSHPYATFIDSMPDNSTVEFANVRLTESTMEYKIGVTGTWTPYISPIELTSNAIVYARYKNLMGNVSSEGTITVSNIDKTNPILKLTQDVVAYTTGNVIITAKATDVESGLSQIQTPDGKWTNASTVDYTATSNGDYVFYAKDIVGNITTKSITISNIDRNAPTLILTQNTTWTNGSITINVKAIDDVSGIKQIILPNGSVVSGDTTSYTVSDIGAYYFKAIDNVGNISINYIIISNIDKNKPMVTINNNKNWSNANSENVVITATDD